MQAALILSGCGVNDGSEIHEAVLTMLHLDQAGIGIQTFAPDAEQAAVVNHCTGQAESGQQRNMLIESARIARGTIKPLAAWTPEACDMVIFPGGFGAARNLCTFADDGPDCRVETHTEQVLRTALTRKIPIGALCIAPTLVARVAGMLALPVQVTIGSDPQVAAAIRAMGAEHIDCAVNQAVTDTTHRVATSPAYMLAGSIAEVSQSAHALVDALVRLTA